MPNAKCHVESDLKITQQTIDKFVNKKYITSGDTKYLPRKKGGTATPHMYFRYLAMKTGWINKLVNEEKTLLQTPQYRPKPWAEPILTLMAAFKSTLKTHKRNG